MAENKSGAQHLASLDVDVSGVFESLKKVDEDIREKGLSIGKNFKSAFNEGMGGTDGKAASNPLNTEVIDNATESVSKLNTEYGKLAKTVQSVNQEGNLDSLNKTFVNQDGIQTLVKYNAVVKDSKTVLEETGRIITDNIAKREADQKKIQEQTQALVNQLDALTRSRELAQIKLTSPEALKDNENLISQINDLSESLKAGNTSIESAKKSLAEFSAQADNIKFTEEGYKKSTKAAEELAAETKKLNDQTASWIEKMERLSRTRELAQLRLTSDDALKDNAELISQINQIIQSLKSGNATIEDAKKAFSGFAEQSDNIKYIEAAYKKEQSALQETQKLKDEFNKRNKSQIDAEIELREKESKAFSAQIKAWLEEQVAQETQAKKVTSQIESMIEKQQKFNNTVAAQKTPSVNREVISQNQELISSLGKLKDEITSSNSVTEEQQKQFESLKSKAKELSTTYEEAGSKGESFLEKISDKAKWLAAFYVVNELKNGFFETIGIIKETEDAVVDLQRVLNDDSISQSKMSAELYDVAYEYGRTFAEVSEVSTQFAQAGYDWADTMELTRGTMLALNTAELDVTQSTEGLIAIMSQWNLEAEDYADVIDKINITADNFAVTSETIVAALQRSSSSAKNANISLEETISIITALAEATGRSGENIGTALNSLIVYTSKTDALKKFAKVGSDTMKQIVADYQAGAASIFDVWEQLSVEVQNLSQQQQEVLFQDEDFQELATELQSALGDVYGAAGTYRQNYFIALLNDMETVQESMRNMEEYAGYSARENEKYMESLTASWNQLQAALAELAVQLGNTGLLDILKSLTNLGTEIVKITSYLGGVVPLLGTISGLIVMIKAQKLASGILDIGSSIKSTVSKAKNLVTSLGAVEAAENKVSAANKALQASFGWIGIIGVALSSLVAIISGVNSAVEASRQAALESANASLEEANAIKELQQEYSDIVNYTGDVSKKTQQLTEFKKKLIEQYGYEKGAVEALNGARQEEIDFLDQEYQSDVRNAWVQIKDQYLDAVDAMENANKSLYLGNAMQFDDDTLEILDKYLNVIDQVDAAGNVTFRAIGFETSDLKEQQDILSKILTSNIDDEDVLSRVRDRYDQITKELEKWSDSYSKGTEIATEFFFVEEDHLDLIQKISNARSEDDAKAYYDQLIEQVEQSNYGLEAQKGLIDTINAMFPQFADEAEDAAETATESFSNFESQLTSVQSELESLNTTIDSFQSALNVVNSAVEEYNTYGQLSVDTIQSLVSLGPEYVSMLETSGGKIRLNEEAVGALINAQKENVVQMLQQSLAADTLKLAQEYLEETTNDVATAQSDGKDDASEYAEQLDGVGYAALRAAAGLSTYGTAAGHQLGIDDQEFKDRANELFEYYQGLIEQVQSLGSGYDPWTGFSSGAKKATKSAEDEIDKLLDKLNDLRRQREEAAVSLTSDKAIEDNQKLLDQIYALISGLQDGTITIDEATKAFEGFDYVVSQIKIEESTYKKLVDEQETLAKDQLDLQDMVLERQKERLEAEKEAVEERYDYEEERAEELSETIQDIQDTWDYLQNRQSLIKEIKQASVRSGVEYREAEMEAKESLAQLDIDRFFTLVQDSLDGVSADINESRERQLKPVEDKIQSVDDKLNDLSDIKSLIGNSQVDLYERFGGDLSNLADKIGNVDEFLSSIGYVVQVEPSAATGAISAGDLTQLAEAVYNGTELTELNIEGILQSFSTTFVQVASSAISAALSGGMDNLSTVIASSIASAIVSAGGYSSSSTTNNNVTNVIGSIASVAGNYVAQNLGSILFKP